MTRFIIRIRFDDRERADMEVFAKDEYVAINKAYSIIPPQIQKHIVMHEVDIAYQNHFDPK